MTKGTASDFTDKWSKRLKGATQDIAKGVDTVTEAPSKLAIAQQEKMLQKLVDAINSGRWAAGLKNYSLEQWKADMKGKGVQRIASGVDGAQDKVTKFAEWLLPQIDSAKAKIKDMPSTTLEDNINRMTTYIREMGSKKYKKQ